LVVLEHGRAYKLQLLHTLCAELSGSAETRDDPLAIVITSKLQAGLEIF